LGTNLSSSKTFGFCQDKSLEGKEAEQKRKKKTGFSGTRPKKNPARAGWLKRLGLVRATL